MWLSGINGIGHKKIKVLIDYFGSPKGVFEGSELELKSVIGISEKDVNNIFLAKDEVYIDDNVRRKLDDLDKRQIEYIDYYDDKYPERLKNIYDYPLGLYVRGRLPKENVPVVAIVGARNCSEYGKWVAKHISRDLAALGVQIVSGMARGIDALAHEGAFEGEGDTFGILGCGIDRCYPVENMNIFMECIEHGGVISEYGIGVLPMACNFPLRNRIISGLADIVLVVEAKKKSGSLITADTALEQGRSVMAVPGRITDAMSEGCNNLILNGASPVMAAMDVVRELGNCGFAITQRTKEDNIFKNITLATSEKIVYDRLCLIPKSIKCIMDECGMEYQKVVEVLINLELMDIIVQTSKGYYARIDE